MSAFAGSRECDDLSTGPILLLAHRLAPLCFCLRCQETCLKLTSYKISPAKPFRSRSPLVRPSPWICWPGSSNEADTSDTSHPDFAICMGRGMEGSGSGCRWRHGNCRWDTAPVDLTGRARRRSDLPHCSRDPIRLRSSCYTGIGASDWRKANWLFRGQAGSLRASSRGLLRRCGKPQCGACSLRLGPELPWAGF